MKTTESIAKEAREELAKTNAGATWLFMIDCAEDLNLSAISRSCFGKSSSWILQKLHGYEVNGKPARFTEKECQILADYIQELADKLNKSAETIRNAKP